MKKIMKIIDDENITEKYEIFCSFDSSMTKKSYVVYTNRMNTEDGKTVLYAGTYEKIDDGTLKVDKRLSSEENKMITNLIENTIKFACN